MAAMSPARSMAGPEVTRIGHFHFGRDDVGQGRLAQAGWAVNDGVVQAAPAECFAASMAMLKGLLCL